MSAAGNWTITVESPMGAQTTTSTWTVDGTTLSGSSENAQGESVSLYDGVVNGDSVSWKVDITSPMPMTLAFEGTISGDSISGQVAAGGFGSFPFSGTRS